MTALEQVLEVEKQVEEEIKEAREKALSMVAEARKEKHLTLANLEAAFVEKEEMQLQLQEKKIQSAVETVQAESDKRVEVLRKNFTANKTVLVDKVKATLLKNRLPCQ